ncbi:acetyl-CoA acetyltransferase [Stenotrophomonas sp. SY1]|uniref:acetyl-CoA acetyltransferase n=1 Tax=Stenotrophomonas sp. SY1 TaxID=477235 RepID=UPI001E4966A1|nr:acetyl-CoA acetyltransferase [Stenotrophomonas sp. SY1]MCD9088297.1 acetyl-CoA acetyltransferase [Stenotrophomonas sp. SY1]
MNGAASIPVIVGVGECLDRPQHPRDGLEPMDLMLRAARAAEDDAGAALLAQVDSLDVVNLVSWPYRDAPGLLAECLGIRPRRTVYGAIGGESPLRFVQQAAQRIGSGQGRVALICGGEAQHTVNRALQLGIELPWTAPADDRALAVHGRDLVHPLAARLGCAQPLSIYPFYETASTAHWQLPPRTAQRESGQLWSRYSLQAANNPNAWLREPHSAEDIVTVAPFNRMVAWPYTKLMVANPQVNQGAALLLTSLEIARNAGVPERNLVYPWGSAYAREPRDFLARDHYWESHAQNAVLKACSELAGGGFEAMELYSCFPCVPKMARRALHLGEVYEPTVTGGLTFFGAPLNNYMTHATCAMVRHLRGSPPHARGLLYGQGEFVTKHHGLVLARRPYPGHPALAHSSVQHLADSHRGLVPQIEIEPDGTGQLEAFTLLYQRDGTLSHGVAMVRIRPGTRTLARVAPDDAWTVAALTDPDISPVGRTGQLRPTGLGHSEWSLVI